MYSSPPTFYSKFRRHLIWRHRTMLVLMAKTISLECAGAKGLVSSPSVSCKEAKAQSKVVMHSLPCVAKSAIQQAYPHSRHTTKRDTVSLATEHDPTISSTTIVGQDLTEYSNAKTWSILAVNSRSLTRSARSGPFKGQRWGEVTTYYLICFLSLTNTAFVTLKLSS